jgi:PAS domain S-box-containing protein
MTKKPKILECFDIVAPILPIAIAWLDKNGIILGINQSALEAIGMTREACIGKNLYEIYLPEIMRK